MTPLSARERAALGAAEAQRRRDTRLARYDDLISRGVSREAAAETVGISPRTAARYDAQLRATTQEGTP